LYLIVNGGKLFLYIILNIESYINTAKQLYFKESKKKRGHAMMKIKALLAIGITLAFVLASFPVTAQEDSEAQAVDHFMNELETMAVESTSYEEFIAKVSTLFDRFEFNSHPVVKDVLQKFINWLLTNNGAYVGGINLGDLFNKDRRPSINDKDRPAYLVISHGSYNRINPKKENTITMFKERLSLWHYGGKTKIFKGKTLIIERQPFSIKQKITGPQFGMMKGFKGFYIDYESKINGNSYVFFFGRADRIRAFDLTPFASK